MAPVSLSKLVKMQSNRREEIEMIGNRMRGRDQNALNRDIVQARIDALNNLWAEARATHVEITSRNDSNEDPYIADNHFQRLRNLYDEILDELLTLRQKFPSVRERNVSRRETEEPAFERPTKLPRLELPTFSGAFEDWDSFADFFRAVVHDDPHMSNATKLRRLKSCLTDAAAKLVKDVPVVGEHYESTWKALVDRFSNPRLTINKLLDSFFETPFLTDESAAELRTFVDNAQCTIRALTNLKAPVSHWDLWLVHALEIRLDSESRKAWESEVTAKERRVASDGQVSGSGDFSRFPTFAELVSFLEKRAQTLTMIQSDKPEKVSKPTSKPNSRKVHHVRPSQSTSSTPAKCPLCSEQHLIGKCPTFLQKSVDDRRADVRNLRLCFNCLGRHKFKSCKSNGRCRNCQGKHHTLIHFNNNNQKKGSDGGNSQFNSNQDPSKNETKANVATVAREAVSSNTCKLGQKTSKSVVLLPTALIYVVGPNGESMCTRALLDQGSEASFISEMLVQQLKLPKRRVQTSLIGVGGSQAGSTESATFFTLQSRINPGFQLPMDALVLEKLTTELPAQSVDEIDLERFKGITLADPQFHVCSKIDVLIGADFYGQLLRAGVKQFGPTSVTAQNTALGWVISGVVREEDSGRAAQTKKVAAFHCQTTDLHESLQAFWTLEEVPKASKTLKPEDEVCENLFSKSHQREKDGRYVVRLPIRSPLPRVASETRRMALGSLNHLQRRFALDPELEASYRKFMRDYETLGHMKPVPSADIDESRAWYIPHHAVVQTAPQRKIRVVFDASRRTKAQHCLNDFLMSGPPLQHDLALILLNWRRFRYVFTADIVKMFRQIRVAAEDQHLQRILWPPEAPKDYQLTTVTYGTTCAPYLAIRTLMQLATDGKSDYPLGAQCLTTDTYVDDTFAGADDLPSALTKRDELISLLRSAGIELDKWAANHADLLPACARQNDSDPMKNIDRDSSVKTLGVQWNPNTDHFNFCAAKPGESNQKLTKRLVLSDTARLFDPLGWLAPVTVTAKILMQDLWIAKSDWDDLLSDELRARWSSYRSSLVALSQVSLPRWLGLIPDSSYEIHGFSDASSRAYAAVVFIRIITKEGQARVSLLGAKTKVAPVKTVSIPNLELCGATLLVRLVCHFRQLSFIKTAPTFLWTDSQIVLTWLNKHPSYWKTFVANRVSFIQTELPSAIWSHVTTKNNPADMATRGMTPDELKTSELWKHGPAWLTSTVGKWQHPQQTLKVLHVQPKTSELEIISKYSSLSRLTRVTAYCLRPLHVLRRQKEGLPSLPPTLTVLELANARKLLIRNVQAHAFSREIEILRNGLPLPKGNALSNLNPILSKVDGLLRVGGRLTNSLLPYERKHPAILPRRSPLSLLFVRWAHRLALHGGTTLTSNIVSQYVWIVRARPLIKSTLRNCIQCQRQRPRTAIQLMGDLPALRVTPARPFTTTGLDYAGPIQVRTSKGRGQRSSKGYIALFICFATKAIHLEVVSDLTSDTFIQAFRRFASRRGICKNLWSDNATTFRGADTELQNRFHAAAEFYKTTAAVLANDGTTWTFIPPNTPHYGGLWEAGVKSTKRMLKQVVGEHTLTFEELSTVLTEIEACLNSRPLSPMSDDPEDLNVLTPAHFLIGATLSIIPDEEPPNVPENRLNRFQLMQRMRNQFWKQWSTDYLNHLQERSKWRKPTDNFAVGKLVLVKDDRYPPSKWPLGRITEVHPGPDELVRVVTVKTATNSLRRHIARLAPISFEESKTEDPKKNEENP